MSEQSVDAPKQADLLLKEADAVRAEIVYKMQLAHRTLLTILVAPSVALPALAKLAEQIVGKTNPGLGVRTALFELVLVVIAACLPLLLLWGNLFVHSQVNGILRGGHWLRNLEQRLDLGSARDGWAGWETWIAGSARRRWDDDLFRWLREGLVFLYYVAAAGIATYMLGDMLQTFRVPRLLGITGPKTAAWVVYGVPTLAFALIYGVMNVFRVRATYSDGRLSNKDSAVVETAIPAAARNAYRPPTGVLRFPYVVASANAVAAEGDPLRLLDESARVLGSYQELYDWDGIFCGGALLRELPPLDDVLEGIIRNFLAAQETDGYVPKSLTHDGRRLDLHELCKPVLAQGALAVCRAHGRHAWLDDATFAALVKFVDHWLRERRGPSGMFKWRTGLESGVDNNAALVGFPPLSVEAVDATCFVARECAALAALATMRADTSLADRMRQAASAARDALMGWSWDETAGMFWNRHVESGLPIKVMSWTGLMPLWGGFLSWRVRTKLIRQHLQPGGPFLTTYGIRTLARPEVAFNNAARAYIWDHTSEKRKEVSNWQGPIWVLPNALIADGLAAHGYRSRARLICHGTLMLLARDLNDQGSMHECYHAESGAPLWASEFLSWNALGLGMSRWLRGASATILPDGLSTHSIELT